jgi:hypothetical protein
MPDGYILQYKLQFSDPGNLMEFESGDKLWIELSDKDHFPQHYIEIDGGNVFKGPVIGMTGETNYAFFANGKDRSINRETYLSSTNISLFVKRKNPTQLPPGFEPVKQQAQPVQIDPNDILKSKYEELLSEKQKITCEFIAAGLQITSDMRADIDNAPEIERKIAREYIKLLSNN